MAGKNNIDIVISTKDQFSKTFENFSTKAGGISTAAKGLTLTAAGVAAGIAAAGAAIAGATTGLFSMAKSTARVYDAVGKFSDRIGISTEALSSYHYVADLSGVSNAALNMGFQRMTRRISEAANGTGVAGKALEELGISIDSIAGKEPDEQFEMIAKALDGVSFQGDKARIAMQFFDSEGVALLQTLSNGSAGLKEMREEAEKFGLVVSEKAAANAAEFNDSLTRMKGSLTGVKNALGEQLLPIFTTMANNLANFVADHRDEIVQMFKKFLLAAIDFGIGAAKAIVWAGDKLGWMADAVKGVATVMGALASAMDKLHTSSQGFIDPDDSIAKAERKLELLNAELKSAESNSAKWNHQNAFLEGRVKTIKELIAKTTAEIAELQTVQEKEGTVAVSAYDKQIESLDALKQKMRETVESAASFSLSEPKKKGKKEEEVKKSPITAETKAALKEVESMYDQHFLTRAALVDKWNAETLKKVKGNKDAEAQLAAIYAEKKKETYEQELTSMQTHLDSITSAERLTYAQRLAKLDEWNEQQKEKFAENKELMQELREMYEEQKNEWELEQWEMRQELELEREEMTIARLESWYNVQKQLHGNNIAYKEKMDALYAKQRRKAEKNERKELEEHQKNKLTLTSLFFKNKEKMTLLHQQTLTNLENNFRNVIFNLGKVFGEKGFKASKALKIAEATIAGYQAAVAAWNAGMSIGTPAAPAFAAAFMAISIAATAAQIASIKSQNYAAAHGGLEYVPAEQTYLLNEGERVLSPRQNADLTTALDEGRVGGGGGVTISTFNLNIEVPNADGLISMSSDDWQDIAQEKVLPAFRTLAAQGYTI